MNRFFLCLIPMLLIASVALIPPAAAEPYPPKAPWMYHLWLEEQLTTDEDGEAWDGGDANFVVDVSELLEFNFDVDEDGDVDASDANLWVYYNIKYATDGKVWHYPEWFPLASDVLVKGEEDCDGHAILLAAILYHQLGFNQILYEDEQIVGGNLAVVVCGDGHAWVEVGDPLYPDDRYVYDPTWGIEMSWSEYKAKYGFERDFEFSAGGYYKAYKDWTWEPPYE